jgi:hypothetical protein
VLEVGANSCLFENGGYDGPTGVPCADGCEVLIAVAAGPKCAVHRHWRRRERGTSFGTAVGVAQPDNQPHDMQSKLIPTEDELIQCARERIDDGRLPEIMPSLISAGYGAGTALCALCDVEILSDHAMYEVNDPRGLDRVLTFHFPCYVIWQCECE